MVNAIPRTARVAPGEVKRLTRPFSPTGLRFPLPVKKFLGFYEVNRITYEGGPAGEFIYAIPRIARRRFRCASWVVQTALEALAQANGRALTSSEEYAVAKMRLFQAFDEGGGSGHGPGCGRAAPAGGRIQAGDLLQMLNI